MRLFIGTYTQTGSEGIYTCSLDPETGALAITATTADQNPSWLTLHPNGRQLYAASELAQGAVSAYAIDQDSGALTPLGPRGANSSKGAHPCHLAIAGGSLIATNYSGGSLTALPIQPDGSLGGATTFLQHTGRGPTERQASPHPHSSLPVGDLLYVADLGLDQIKLYQLVEGDLRPHDPPFVALEPGAGPRHMAISHNQRFLYVANELNSTLCSFKRLPDGSLEPLQSLSTLPAAYEGINYPADIHLHPSGRFLYLSNREHDSIARFAVDPESGALTPAGHFPSGGRWPRSFAIDPTGRYLVAAHQKGDSVVSHRIEPESGALTPTGHSLAIPTPVCVQFAR